MNGDSITSIERIKKLAQVATDHKYSGRFKGHTVSWAVARCADGRVVFERAVRAQPGTLRVFRSVGANFSVRNYAFRSRLQQWLMDTPERYRVIFTVFHFHRNRDHLGCKGHGHKTHVAKEAVERLSKEILEAFRTGDEREIIPIVVGYETSEDALTLYGPGGELSLSLYPI